MIMKNFPFQEDLGLYIYIEKYYVSMPGTKKQNTKSEKHKNGEKNIEIKEKEISSDNTSAPENFSSGNIDELLWDIHFKQICDLVERDKKKKISRSNKNYIQNNNSRVATFLKRRKGIMKKAFELAVTTNSQILLICVPENNKSIYSFSTHKFKPFIEDFKEIIIKYAENKEEFHPEQREFFGLHRNGNERNICPQYVYNDNISNDPIDDIFNVNLFFPNTDISNLCNNATTVSKKTGPKEDGFGYTK